VFVTMGMIYISRHVNVGCIVGCLVSGCVMSCRPIISEVCKIMHDNRVVKHRMQEPLSLLSYTGSRVKGGCGILAFFNHIYSK